MKTWIKISLVLLILGIIGSLGVYKFVYNKQHPDFENLTPDFSLTAAELYQKFKTSPTASAGTFNGKIIDVSGTLSKIETTDSLVIAVFVMGQGDFGDQGVRCTMLKKFNYEAQKLQPDGEVRIKGYCTGYNESDVILEKCSIVSQ